MPPIDHRLTDVCLQCSLSRRRRKGPVLWRILFRKRRDMDPLQHEVFNRTEARVCTGAIEVP